ncbi:Glycerophosphodiester phosphodiesterase [Bertholletia excelsa]
MTSHFPFLPAVLLLIIALINHGRSQSPETADYDRCAPFTCGGITFDFPFFKPSGTFGSGIFDCGLPRFQVACSSSSVQLLFLGDRLVTVRDQKLFQDITLDPCNSVRNLTIPISDDTFGMNLLLPLGGVNLTVFKCPQTVHLSSQVLWNYTCKEGVRAYVWDGTKVDNNRPLRTPSGCERANLPVSGKGLHSISNRSSGDAKDVLLTAVTSGFELQWNNWTDCWSCQQRNGRCGYNRASRRIVCFHKGGRRSKRWKLIVGIATGSFSAFIAIILLLIFKHKRRASAVLRPSCLRDDQMTGARRKTEEIIKTYQSTLLTKYSYSDIKKMTRNFNEKLGRGGYGNVFKGEMSDGRLVAVKMLQNFRDNNQNFLSEISTIGRIHHLNIIRLLGFCWDGIHEALIYEYMPNGSLGDLMSKGELISSLGLSRLLEIVTRVAYGLEYLHNGCESRILHLDIKPQNVLLDQNFNPKISDFGLAKVYSRNQSEITMTSARGTIGYIAPEIFMRNFGNPSYKSDVYSFGMLLLEITGATKHVEPETTDSTEAYFPSWLYDKLVKEKDEEFSDSVVGEEEYLEKKMVMVGLWCIQMNPRNRPSMTRVIEMLSGDLEAIAMPPRPLLFSLPRMQSEHEMEISCIESESSALNLTGDSQEAQCT